MATTSGPINIASRLSMSISDEAAGCEEDRT
jgi:hypothetical protein